MGHGELQDRVAKHHGTTSDVEPTGDCQAHHAYSQVRYAKGLRVFVVGSCSRRDGAYEQLAGVACWPLVFRDVVDGAVGFAYDWFPAGFDFDCPVVVMRECVMVPAE